MKMKKFLLALVVSMSLIPAAGFAQRPARQPDCRIRPPRGHVDPTVQYRNEETALFKALELTDAQKASVKSIRTDFGEQNDKLREKTEKQREKNEKAFLKKMKKVLTSEQYEKFLKFREAKCVRRGGKTNAGRGCAPARGCNVDCTPACRCAPGCAPEVCPEETQGGMGPITKGPTPQLMTE